MLLRFAIFVLSAVLSTNRNFQNSAPNFCKFFFCVVAEMAEFFLVKLVVDANYACHTCPNIIGST